MTPAPPSAWATRAEMMKLARLLDVPVEELGYLDSVPVEDLRRLREQVTELLFDAGGGLGRLAAASRVLPASVIAAIGEHAFGPILAARIAGLLDPLRAAEVAEKLPTEFLAEVAVHLDPRRAAGVLAQIPPERIGAVAGLLSGAGEHVTLGRFVGHLPDRAIALALERMDDLTVLRTGFVLEDPAEVERVLALLDERRLDGLLDAAVGTDLWPEVMELVTHAREPLRSRVLGAQRRPSG